MGRMRLEGWNSIPAGFGASFDLAAAPWWLRLWFRTPFLDRFAYPRLVARGHGWLTADPEASGDVESALARGWRIDTEPPAQTVLTYYPLARYRLRRLAQTPMAVTLPGGVRFERRIHLSWLVRLALWVVLGGLGLWAARVPGAVTGLACAALVEIAVSYRRAPTH